MIDYELLVIIVGTILMVSSLFIFIMINGKKTGKALEKANMMTLAVLLTILLFGFGLVFLLRGFDINLLPGILP